jgi:dolichol kinase
MLFNLELLFAVLSAFSVLVSLVFYRRPRDIFLLSVFVVLSVLLSAYQQYAFAEPQFGTIIILTGMLLVFAFLRVRDNRLLLLFLAYLVMFLLATLNTYPYLVAESLLIGIMSGIFLFDKKSTAVDENVEIKRDVVQIFAGILLIAMFYFIQYIYPYPYTFIFLITVFGIGIVKYLETNFGAKRGRKHSTFGKALWQLERKGTSFGRGALWLASGSLLILIFMPSVEYIIVGLAALFIGDSLATILGLKFGKLKLFYNKKKSVVGTAAYFISISLIGYLFIGYYAILLAAAAAIVESLPLPLDDNFDSAVALIIVAYLLLVLQPI